MEARFIDVKYVQGESIRVKNDFKIVRRFFREGYSILKKEDGYCDLKKSTKANLTFVVGNKVQQVNIGCNICRYYAAKELTKELVERFSEDAKSGKIKLMWDSQKGYCTIM